MLNVVFLPVSDPGDDTHGAVPERIKSVPDAVIHKVYFSSKVWYNKTRRKEAIRQIEAIDTDSIILVGFSKSGLGAWNIAREIPDRVAGTIIFDSPMTNEELPRRKRYFYKSAAIWKRDLPMCNVQEYHAAMPKDHTLVLISGERFHDQMHELSQELHRIGCDHVFLPRPQLEHHWNSGWIEEGFKAMFGELRAPAAES